MMTFEVVDDDFDINEDTMKIAGKSERWYQAAARNQSVMAIVKGLSTRLLIKKPTGVGKTLTSQGIILDSQLHKFLTTRSNKPVMRVLYLSHLHRLLTQSKRGFGEYTNVKIVDSTNYETSHFNTYAPEHQYDGKHDIEIMYHSIKSELPEGIEFDLVFMDEFHHEACYSVQYMLEYVLPHVPLIGMTATNERPDNFLLKFDYKVEPISREQAVKEGWLAETDLYSFVDISGRDKTAIVIDILNYYEHQMEGTMVFMRTKKECRVIEQYISEKLERSVVVIDNQSKQEVDRILDDFSLGKIDFLVNCNKLGEGVDVVGCSDVVIGCNIGSYPKLNQIIGRTARPDSASRVYELINPLSSTNKDTTVVIGTPRTHKLIYKRRGAWLIEDFVYDTIIESEEDDDSVEEDAYEDELELM